MRTLFSILALTLFFGAMVPAAAVEPDEILKDPALEERARDISKNLRCLVCQNQSIDDSNAGLARDLRVLVRERLVSGDSDEQVLQFVVDRYGDYVLLKPPFKASTYVLWIGPAVIVLCGVLALAVYYRRRAVAASRGTPAPLSAEEQRRLDEILKEDAS